MMPKPTEKTPTIEEQLNRIEEKLDQITGAFALNEGWMTTARELEIGDVTRNTGASDTIVIAKSVGSVTLQPYGADSVLYGKPYTIAANEDIVFVKFRDPIRVPN